MVRIVAGPAAGRLADHLRAHKIVVVSQPRHRTSR
jgi:hypothetical protein